MSNPIDHEKSALIKRVYDESKQQKKNTSQNLYSILEGYVKKVLPQLTQINLLFSEYTPHDQSHIESLFRIADDLLGTEIIDKLKGSEACILSCAIYGHDWGMAVSVDEKEFITTGRIPNGRTKEEFALLEDENYQWKKYAQLKNLHIDDNGYSTNSEEVRDEVWREYVRLTHAERSKSRTIDFFKGGEYAVLGDLIGEVCAGHWYEASKIQALPTSKLACGQQNNLKALTTYMRFIDLMDIGNNRTPYSLWKFVYPRNLFSRNEWKKHLALEPVFFDRSNANYLKIQIQGKTSDHKVYAALKDMKTWISNQIKENEQILEGFRDYSLGYIKLDWNVEADGFEPIDIRFEFDRSKMFDLISGEIYNGDPYVFLRELIQNSIDAIKIKQIQYLNNGLQINPNNLAININVSHKENGDSKITINDSGTGMSLNIIHNYLSVIGKSYYRSDDFKSLGLEINPISRFGVGLISCFEVADSICIQTKFDPVLSDEEEDSIGVEIENYNQQFRVRKLPKDSISVGTQITVNVLGSKWKKDDFQENSTLKVTEYLKTIIGFCPNPIVIQENETKTLIVASNTSAQQIDSLKKTFKIENVWCEPQFLTHDEAFENIDVEAAKFFFSQTSDSFSMDLKGLHVSGTISYFFPTDKVLGTIRRAASGISDFGFSVYFSTDRSNIFLKHIRAKPHGPNAQPKSICESAKRTRYNAIYFNGILAPGIKNDFLNPHNSLIHLPSRTLLNITLNKQSRVNLSLSRNNIKGSEKILETVLQPLFKNIFKSKFDQFDNDLAKSSLKKRLFLLAKLWLFVPHARVFLDQFYSIDQWPFPYLSKEGIIRFTKVVNLPEAIEVIPKKNMIDRKDFGKSLLMEEFQNEKFKDVGSLFRQKMYIKNFGFDYDDGSPMEWNAINNMLEHTVLAKNFTFFRIRILKEGDERYIIENWKRGVPKDTEERRERINPYHFKFTNIESDEGIFCVLPIEHDVFFKVPGLSKMIFNNNHKVTKVLDKALTAYDSNIDKSSIPDDIKSNLRLAFHSNPFIGTRRENLPGNNYPTQIGNWVRKFCEETEKASLISMTPEERQALEKPLLIYACHE